MVRGGARKSRLARQNLGPRVCIAQRVDQPAAVIVAIYSQPARMPHLPAGGQRGFLVEESGKEFLLAPRETAHAAFACEREACPTERARSSSRSSSGNAGILASRSIIVATGPTLAITAA